MGKINKKTVLDFNHISNDLSEEAKITLKELYSHYHRKAFCYNAAYKHYLRVNTALNITAIVLTVSGTIIGAITLNPIVLGVVTGSGVLLHGFLKIKNYDRKLEMNKFASASYQNILNKIRSYLRGQDYKVAELISEMCWLDDIVVDFCQNADKYEKKYNSMYSVV